MSAVPLLAQAILPLLIGGVILLFLALCCPVLRVAVIEAADGVDRLGADAEVHLVRLGQGVRSGLRGVCDQLTGGGRHSFASLLVCVPVIVMLLVCVLVAELRLWSGYFESLFTDLIEVAPFGEITGGFLRALLLVAAGLLLGFVGEALAGLLPFPILSIELPVLRDRVRIGIAVVAALLWCSVVGVAVDLANEVYDALGPGVCAQRLLDSDSAEAPPPLAAFDRLTSQVTVGAAADPQPSSAALAACTTEWEANTRGRLVQVVLAILALHLSALFGFAFMWALGLGVVGVLALTFVPLCLVLVAVRIGRVVVKGVFRAIDLVLQISRLLCTPVIRRLPPASVIPFELAKG